MIQKFRRLAFCAALLLAAASAAHAQDEQGPAAPPPKFDVHRISNIPHPGPPPIPAEEIIQKFTANEDVMKKDYQAYDFQQAIRVEELGKPGGKWTVTGEVYTKPDGQRYFRVIQPPQSTLKVASLSLEDVRTIVGIPLFILTTDELPNYVLKYVGDEKLDQLHTYIFSVKPKELSRKRRFFEGVVWVDDHDFVIVKSYGHFISEIEGEGTRLPFTMFETYRENFQEKYWLPTYTSSDDVMEGPGDAETHLRLVIHDTDFTLRTPATSTTPSPAPPPQANSR